MRIALAFLAITVSGCGGTGEPPESRALYVCSVESFFARAFGHSTGG